MIYDIYQNKTIGDIDKEDEKGKGNYIIGRKDKFDGKNDRRRITIFSPLFDILSKTKNFENFFTIDMSLLHISKMILVKHLIN